MSDGLRNSLWNVLDMEVWSGRDFVWAQYGEPGIKRLSRSLWFHYFKKPVDERPTHGADILGVIRKYFFASPWNKVYEFIEFVVSELKESHPRLAGYINFVL